MGMKCTVCIHPARDEIDRCLLTGSAGRRTISNKFGVSENAVQRHRTLHLSERVRKSVERRQSRADDVFSTRLEMVWSETEQYLQDAKSAVKYQRTGKEEWEALRDIGAMSQAIAAAHKNIELFGMGTGRLRGGTEQAHGGGTHITIVIPRSITAEQGQVIDVKAQLGTPDGSDK